MTPSELARFEKYVDPEPMSGCWLWNGGLFRDGYGNFSAQSGTRAHRLAYEHFIGPVPDGLVLDHKCRVRCCVNPRHVEPVPNRVNVLRGFGRAALQARQTHCIKGHPLDGQNLIRRNTGGRRCRTCTHALRSTPEYRAATHLRNLRYHAEHRDALIARGREKRRVDGDYIRARDRAAYHRAKARRFRGARS